MVVAFMVAATVVTVSPWPRVAASATSPYNLTGTIVDVDGAPLEGITVGTWHSAGGWTGTSNKTSADGSFTLAIPLGWSSSALSIGRRTTSGTVSAFDDYYSVDFSLPVNESVALGTLRLPGQQTYLGKAVDSTGAAVEGARLNYRIEIPDPVYADAGWPLSSTLSIVNSRSYWLSSTPEGGEFSAVAAHGITAQPMTYINPIDRQVHSALISFPDQAHTDTERSLGIFTDLVAPQRPGPPGSVTARPGNATLAVSWSPAADGAGGAVITQYLITIETPDDSEWWVQAAASTDTSATVPAPPGVPVTVKVQATNVIGRGPAVSVGRVRAYRAPDAPRAIKVTPRQGGALVSWTPPGSTGGVALSGYTLTTGTKVLHVPASARSATLTGLRDGTTYTVSVTAQNLAGSSPAASANFVPGSVPGRVAKPRIRVRGDMVTVRWVAPVSHGFSVDKYRVLGLNPARWVVHGRWVMLGEVKHGKHRVRVQAHNAKGWGPASVAKTVRVG